MLFSKSTGVLAAVAASFLPMGSAVCYNNTESMITAQLQGETKLEICAESYFEIGMPTSANLTNFTGMPPLLILKDNVEVYCGPDGSVENNCVFDGGVLQLITNVDNPMLPNVQTTSTNNLRVSGVTFTGQLKDIPGVVEGTSVALGAPGTNITFDDCFWHGMTAQHFFFLTRTAYTSQAMFPALSANVTISNSKFRDNFVGSDTIYNDQQILTLQNVHLEHINYIPLCNCPTSYLMDLNGGSITTLENVKVVAVQTLTTMIGQFGNSTELMYNSSELFITDFSVVGTAHRNSSDYCSGGLIVDTKCVKLNMTNVNEPSHHYGGGSSGRPGSMYSSAPSSSNNMVMMVFMMVGSFVVSTLIA